MDIGDHMNASHDSCQEALAHLRRAVDMERRFPRNIFLGDWSDFYFFDSDWMREANFVEHVKAILEIESGQCACLWKLDSEGTNGPSFFFVRGQTEIDDYRALLAGHAPGHGWLDALERLACASDVGAWCMYCEPNNEIAVIGFRHKGASARYSRTISQFRAERIDLALEEPLSYGFSQVAAAPEWRDAFLREYGARSF